MTVELLLPDVDADAGRDFWAAAHRHELVVQTCAECAAVHHPPRPVCPECGSTARRWRTVAGTGTVWSHVTVHPPLLPAYAAAAPYNVIVVQLDDVPVRMVGNLVSTDAAASPTLGHCQETPAIGTPVRVVFDRVTDDVTLPRWVTR